MAYVLAPTLLQYTNIIPYTVDLFFSQIYEWIMNENRIRSVKKQNVKLENRITELTRRQREV